MTCKPVKAAVWPSKSPTAVLDYGVNFERECARQWRAMKDYTISEHIRVFDVGKAAGFEFAPTAGRSGSYMPAFPTVLNAQVADGSILWTCVALSADSLLRTITGTPTWECEDTDLTIGVPSIIDFIATNKLGAGLADEDYLVKVTALTNDSLALTKYIVLPVRIPINPQTVCVAAS